MVIDFEKHERLEGDPEEITILLSSPHAELSPPILQRTPETGGLRLAFSFDPGERDLAELRAELRRGGMLASEVWLYRWTA